MLPTCTGGTQISVSILVDGLSNQLNATFPLIPRPLKLFSNALDINPRFYQALYSRAHAEQELGRYDEAVAACDEAVRLMPENPSPYSHRAKLNTLRTGHMAEALRDYEMSARLGGDGCNWGDLAQRCEAAGEESLAQNIKASHLVE
jgi:tetratricopeptide (TPR) repeat protein